MEAKHDREQAETDVEPGKTDRKTRKIPGNRRNTNGGGHDRKQELKWDEETGQVEKKLVRRESKATRNGYT